MFDENNIQEFIDIFLEAKEPLTLKEVGNRWAAKHLRICFIKDLFEIKKFLEDNDIFLFDKTKDTWEIFTLEPVMKVVYWDWYNCSLGYGELAEAKIYYSEIKKAWLHYFTIEKFDTERITKILWKNF